MEQEIGPGRLASSDDTRDQRLYGLESDAGSRSETRSSSRSETMASSKVRADGLLGHGLSLPQAIDHFPQRQDTVLQTEELNLPLEFGYTELTPVSALA